jgi:microcystin-dependent protein
MTTAPRIGEILAFGGTVIPTGFLACDASAVSRTTYSQLFAVIGTSFGAGDGSTTFNLPSAAGRLLVGYKSGDASFGTVGTQQGSPTINLQHTHTQNPHTHVFSGTVNPDAAIEQVRSGSSSNASRSDHVHNFSITSGVPSANTMDSQLSTAQNINNPFVVLNFIIRFLVIPDLPAIDNVTVTENIKLSIPLPVIINDSVSVSERVNLNYSLPTPIIQNITVTDYPQISYSLPTPIVSSVTVTENLSMLIPSLLNPTNAYVSDGSFAQLTGAASGQLDVSISINGGVSFTPFLSRTFDVTEQYLDYGTSTTELWGETLLGSNIDNTNLRIKFSHNNGFSVVSQVYKDFGFAIAAHYILSGLHIGVEAKYIAADQSIYIDNIHAMIHYGTSILPIRAGSQAYASNGRKAGEPIGTGTGVFVFYDSQNMWIACDTGTQVLD